MRRPRLLVVLAAVLVLVVTGTGIEAIAHGHFPGLDDGSVQARPLTAANDHPDKPCSLCAIAHQSACAAGPVLLSEVPAEPARAAADSALAKTARLSVSEDSPRAPPATSTVA